MKLQPGPAGRTSRTSRGGRMISEVVPGQADRALAVAHGVGHERACNRMRPHAVGAVD